MSDVPTAAASASLDWAVIIGAVIAGVCALLVAGINAWTAYINNRAAERQRTLVEALLEQNKTSQENAHTYLTSVLKQMNRLQDTLAKAVAGMGQRAGTPGAPAGRRSR